MSYSMGYGEAVRNSDNISGKRNAIIDIMFPGDGMHDGNVQILNKTKTSRMQYAFFSPASEASYRIGNFEFHNSNYYISLNTFTKDRARSEDLFSLCNIVVDIDCHGSIRKRERKEAERLFHEILTGDLSSRGIPAPTFFQYTGRGVQVFWNMIQISATNTLYVYKTVALYLAVLMEDLIASYPELSKYSVDKPVSVNPCTVVRMPYTYNRKAHRDGNTVITGGNQLDLFAFYGENKERIVSRFKKDGLSVTMEKKTITDQSREEKPIECSELCYRERGLKVADALEKIIRKRAEYGESWGRRDESLFCYAAQLASWLPWSKVFEKLEYINSLFEIPLSSTELRVYFKSMKEKAYKVSYNQIVFRMQLTEEEIQKSGLYLLRPKNTKGEGRRPYKKRSAEELAQAKEEYARINNEIRRMAKEGLSNRQIAQEVGLTAAAVACRMKKHGIRSSKEARTWKVIRLLKQNTPVSVIAELVKCTVQNVYCIKKKLEAKNNALKEKQRIREEAIRLKKERQKKRNEEEKKMRLKRQEEAAHCGTEIIEKNQMRDAIQFVKDMRLNLYMVLGPVFLDDLKLHEMKKLLAEHGASALDPANIDLYCPRNHITKLSFDYARFIDCMDIRFPWLRRYY